MRCKICDIGLSFPISFDSGLCANCRGKRVLSCTVDGCYLMCEAGDITSDNYCPTHRESPADLGVNPLKGRCILCKVKDIPIDVAGLGMDDSKRTSQGLVHNACYETAKYVLEDYVDVSRSPTTTNIRARKMRIDP